MAWLDDLSRFAGNMTGGFIGESDEERRRKRQQQQQKSTLPVGPARNTGSVRVGSAPSGRVSVSSGNGSNQKVTVVGPKQPSRGLTVKNEEEPDFDLSKGIEALKKAPGEFIGGVTDSLVDMARAIPRAAVMGVNTATGKKEYKPTGGIEKVILGSDPVKDAEGYGREGADLAGTIGTVGKENNWGDKLNTGVAVPLGLALGLSDVAPLGGARKKGMKEIAKTIEDEVAKQTISDVEKATVQAQLDALRSGGKQQGYVEKQAPVREVSPEALLTRATDAGMSEASAVSLMDKYGRNKFTIMLDESNGLKGAKNPNGLAASVLAKIPDGNVQIGGVARKTDELTIDQRPLSGEPLRSGEQMQPDGKIVNIVTGEIRDPSMTAALPEPPRAPRAEPEVEGSMGGKSVADEFSEEASQAYAREQQIWGEIDNQLTKAGHDPVEVRQKIAASARGEYQPTETDLQAFGLIQGELDSARTTLAAQGIEFDGNIQHYRPEQRLGSVKTAADQYTREDRLDFGYQKKRTNAIPLSDMDYSANPEVDYTYKARNRELTVKDSIARSAEQDGRQVTREGVEAAAKDTIELQDTIKGHAEKSGKVFTHDTLGGLNKIGKNEGYPQEINSTRAGLSQEPKGMLERSGVYDRGFEQYVNAEGYANELVRMADEAGVDVSQAMPDALRKAFPAGDDSSLGNIASWAERRLSQAETPEQRSAIIRSAFRQGAKAELHKLGKTTVFADKKMAKVVNEQMNNILINDAYHRNIGEKIDRFVSRRINESLRGANLLSASFEASDFFNILSDFGVKNTGKSKIGLGKVDGDYYGMSKRYGKADQHFLSDDIPEEAAKFDKIWTDPNTNVGQKIYQSLRNARDKTLLFKYVEKWKTELFLRQADAFYRAKGLQGKELVDMVNNHYDKTMLPSTALTMNRLVGKAPRALTQYLSWAINSTKRLGRTISGSNEYGKYADMGRPSRIARGIGVEIVPKAVTAMALGVPIAQVMGGRDWTGVSSGDYSGIQAEDKTVVDEIVNTLAVSPTLGMVANLYNGYRTNQEGIEEGEAESPWLKNAMLKNGSMLVPYFSQGKKVADIIQGQSRGYYENSDGRIQTGALPTGEAIQGALVGKSYTPTFRDMRDNPDAISVARGTAQVQDLVTHNDTVDNVSRALLDKPTARDYTRPLSKDYTKAYKEAEKGARDALLKGGRQYNDYLDTLRQQSPELYERYLGTMDGDHVKPEYWRTIFAGKDGKADLTTFKVLAERKRQLKTDLGKDYDPMYDLPDDQAKAFLEYRSTPTGDNIAIRNILGKEQWYKDLKAARKTFYDANPLSPEGEEFKKSERVKAWETYEDKLNSFFYDAEEIAKSGDPAWAKDFPLVYRQKQLNDQFGFDAPETKEFFKANYDSWKAQKDNFDKAQLEVINQMRKLEGYPPMSWDGYQQATEFADTDESDDSSSSSSKGYGRSGRGGRGGGKSSDRTGVASTITELGNEGAGMKLPTGPKGKMKNLKTVVKNKRANGTSPIRIRI